MHILGLLLKEGTTAFVLKSFCTPRTRLSLLSQNFDVSLHTASLLSCPHQSCCAPFWASRLLKLSYLVRRAAFRRILVVTPDIYSQLSAHLALPSTINIHSVIESLVTDLIWDQVQPPKPKLTCKRYFALMLNKLHVHS